MTVAVLTDVPEHVPTNGALIRARGIAAGLTDLGIEASLLRVAAPEGARIGARHRSLASAEQCARLIPDFSSWTAFVLAGIAFAPAVGALAPRPVVLDVCDSVTEAWGRRILRGDIRAVAGLASVLGLAQRGRGGAAVSYVTATDLQRDRLLWGRTPRLLIPNGVSDDVASVPPLDGFRRRAGYVADLSYHSNRVGFTWLLDRVWPELARAGWELEIFGPTPPDRPLPPQATYVGYLPSLASVYERVDVTFAPTFDGAGFKNKVAESVAAGRPVITTTLGARAQLSSPGLLVADVAEEWVAHVRSLESHSRLLNLSAAMAGARAMRTWSGAVGDLVPFVKESGVS